MQTSALDKYLKLFSSLRTDRGAQRWSALTRNRAPHKPFLLLSVMDLVAQGVITSHFIEPTQELVDTFNSYWQSVMPGGSSGSLAYPFPQLQSDGFWQRVPNEGFDAKTDYNVSSIVGLRQVYAGALIDEELLLLLARPDTRESLRVHIVKSYFEHEVQARLLEQGTVNYEAFQYSRRLLESREALAVWPNEASEKQLRVRSQGFRRAVVNLYEHRCALCGIRMLTPDGHTIVEAAHIIPWIESRDDHPTNGLALCRLCHWSFDEGLMGVGKRYEVMVSSLVQQESNLPGHVLTLQDRRIFPPAEDRFLPRQDNLAWHREQIFKN